MGRQQGLDEQHGPGRIRRLLLRSLVVLAVVLVLVVAGFLVWALTPLGPDAVALTALESVDGVAVTHAAGAWIFLPASGPDVPETGLIFYPGGRVDARSYAPFARALAAEGHAVVIAEVPLSLAVFDANAADDVLAMPPVAGVSRWAVGGHSLGGAMAAQYLADGVPDRVHGLLLLAAYPPGSTDLSGSALAVTDVTASLDTVLDRGAWEAGQAHLPEDTRRVTIEGGNHAGFGSYGEQPGDSSATLAPAEQLLHAVQAADELLDRM